MDNENTMAAKLVAARGNRLTAILLGWMEENIKADLTDDQWFDLRDLIRDQVNGYKDLIIDIVKSDTAYINQLWVEKIDEIHRDIKHLNAKI